MSAMPLASAILSAWALSRLDKEQSRQIGSRAADKKAAASKEERKCVWPNRARRQIYKRAAVAKNRWHSVVALQSQGAVPLSNGTSNFNNQISLKLDAEMWLDEQRKQGPAVTTIEQRWKFWEAGRCGRRSVGSLAQLALASSMQLNSDSGFHRSQKCAPGSEC